VEGTEAHGVHPAQVAFLGEHVYYQRATTVPPRTVIDEETGPEFDNVELELAIERVVLR
jgi:hypothetical protein